MKAESEIKFHGKNPPMDCPKLWAFLLFFSFSLLISFIRAQERENRAIAPCGEKDFVCVSAKTFSRNFFSTFLIFYCFVANKIFMYQRKFLSLNEENVPTRLRKKIWKSSFILVFFRSSSRFVHSNQIQFTDVSFTTIHAEQMKAR
jgi:hypothetical protein